MKRTKVPPHVVAPFAVAREFAQARGLEASYSSHWDETISIGWEEGSVHKMTLVFVYQLWVEGVAQTRAGSPPAPVEVRRGFGRSDQAESGWQGTFRQHLEGAWEWLRRVDAASVVELDAADQEHALSRIAPMVQEFASGEGLSVRNFDRHRCILEWPRDVPQYQLAVLYSPDDGISFIGLQYVRRGLVLKRRFPVECGDLRDLAEPEWTKLDDIASRLAKARARVEACIPGKDAVETYV